MRFCLIEARKINAITPAKRLLSEYIINSMKDGHWLISSDFESLISDISTKYRNGGVHEHLVTYEICQEAVERILVGREPVLKLLLKSTETK